MGLESGCVSSLPMEIRCVQCMSEVSSCNIPECLLTSQYQTTFYSFEFDFYSLKICKYFFPYHFPLSVYEVWLFIVSSVFQNGIFAAWFLHEQQWESLKSENLIKIVQGFSSFSASKWSQTFGCVIFCGTNHRTKWKIGTLNIVCMHG